MELKKCKLGDIGKIEGGATPLTSDEENYNGDIAWITPNDLSSNKSVYIERGERNITEKGLNSIGGRLLPIGTVLFSSRAPIGYVAIAKNELCTNQGFKSIIPNPKKVDSKYLYYLLKQSKDYIEKQGSGTTFLEVSGAVMKDIKLYFPSLDNQKKISQVLYSIDKEIELNQRINERLERMAKRLYDYWFVQFDFPNDDGKPYKSSGGEMVWNEELKREIPKGWDVVSFDDIASVKKGDLITESEVVNGEIKVVSAGIDYTNKHNVSNRRANVITVSASGANAGYINFWREPIFASDCTTIQCNDDINTIFCYYMMRYYQKHLYQITSGSAQPHVYPYQIKELPMIVIPNKYKKIVREFFLKNTQKIACYTLQNEYLNRIKKILLPMLMNGQITIE